MANEHAEWLKRLAKENTAESIKSLAFMFATFYLGLVEAGVPAAEAVVLTDAYINATVTMFSPRPTDGVK